MAVVIETTLGDITVDLYLDQRPITCLNFLKLCKMKYYNFNLFHSIRNGFIAQTGDPTGEGSGGQSIWGILEGPEKRFFAGEKMPKIRHTDAGLLSMVCTDDMMVGSQFFITLAPDLDSLDGTHCVIGEVTEGHEVLTKLNEVICDENHRPYRDVRITHTVVLEDPFSDPSGLRAPSRSPSPNPERLKGGRIAPDEEIDETQGKSVEEVQEMIEEKEAKARATILEIVGDLPDAEIAPPENVLFVCKLNPVTTDEDLEIIFSRFGKIVSCEVIRDKKTGNSLQYAFIEFENKKSCEDAYFKMDNVLIDDRRIHVDFSQSVSKIRWLGKGRGVQYFDNDSKPPESIRDNKRKNRNEGNQTNDYIQDKHNNHRNDKDNEQTRERDREQGHNRDKERRSDRGKEHRYHKDKEQKCDNDSKQEHDKDRGRRHDKEQQRQGREREQKGDREQRRDREQRYDRHSEQEYNKGREQQKQEKGRERRHDRDSEQGHSRDKEHKYERDKRNVKERSRSRSRLNESQDRRREQERDIDTKEKAKYTKENDTIRHNENGNSKKYDYRYNSRSNKSKHSPIRNKKEFTELKNYEKSECRESRTDKKNDKNHLRRQKDENIKYANSDNCHENHNSIESYKDGNRERHKHNEEAMTPSPTLKRKKVKRLNKNKETKSYKKSTKQSHRKRKSRSSTSTSDSSECTSSSESSSSSESDRKKKRLQKKKRKYSTSSSSTDSSSSSSSSDSSSTSSSSDSGHRKKKHKTVKNSKSKNKK